MTSQITHHPSTSLSILRETAPKRAILSKLAAMGTEIEKFGTQDTLSQELIKWRKGLSLEIKKISQVEPIVKKYISLLKEMLVDSFTSQPLAGEIYIGSDEHIYNGETLCLSYFSTHIQNRSPLNPQSDTPLTVKRHTSAEWIRDQFKEHFRFSDEFLKLYSELPQESLQYAIPTIRNLRLRRIQHLRNVVQKNSLKTPENRTQAIIEFQVAQHFSPLQKRIDLFNQEQMHKIQLFEDQSRLDLSSLEREVTNIELEISELQGEVETLERSLNSLQSDLSEAKLQVDKLKILVKELEIAIKKRRNMFIKNVLIGIGSMAACSLGTFILKSALSSSSAANAALISNTLRVSKATSNLVPSGNIGTFLKLSLKI